MPYIEQERREQYNTAIRFLQIRLKNNKFQAGDLNYIISRLIGFYFKENSRYWMVALIDGVLKDVASEFYRRIVIPYENKAIAKNGDIEEYKNN